LDYWEEGGGKLGTSQRGVKVLGGGPKFPFPPGRGFIPTFPQGRFWVAGKREELGQEGGKEGQGFSLPLGLNVFSESQNPRKGFGRPRSGNFNLGGRKKLFLKGFKGGKNLGENLFWGKTFFGPKPSNPFPKFGKEGKGCGKKGIGG